jgi:hypothetical protein
MAAKRGARGKVGGAKSGRATSNKAGVKRKRAPKAKPATARRAPAARPTEKRRAPPAPAAMTPRRRARAGEDPCGVPGDTLSPAVRAAMAAGEAGATREAVRGVLIGMRVVPADKWGDGYDKFRVRTDLEGSYLAVRERVLAFGGLVTSSGGIRDPSAPVTAGRSKTSLHYTARAIDLNIDSGLRAGATPYIVVRDGGTDERPLWRVYAVLGQGNPGSPLYDESLIEERDWPALVWREDAAPKTISRRARCVCLTELFAAAGWARIPARAGWKQDYLCCEWWHFQNETGLQAGVTTFGGELRKLWPAQVVDKSNLALGALWSGGAFRV